MRKYLAVIATVALGACSSGGPVTGPSEVETVAAPAPVAAAQPPVSQPVDAPPSGTTSVVNFYPNATFEAFNNSGDAKNFTAIITSFDDQVTPLVAPKAQLVAAGKSWNDGFGAQCVQLDVEGDGGQWHMYYDKAGKGFTNPHANAEKIAECRCTPEWKRQQEPEVIYGEWQSGEQCSRTRTVTYRYTEKQTCTNLTRTVNVAGEPQNESTAKEPTFFVGTLTYPTYTPAQPKVPAVYNTVAVKGYNFNNNDSKLRDACEAEGGTWYHDDPNSNKQDVCITNVNHGSEWKVRTGGPDWFPIYKTGDFFTYDYQVLVSPEIPAVPASGGNPISGLMGVQGAATWKLILKATSPGNYNKDVEERTLSCSEGPVSLNVSYNWIGHSSENWFLELYKNGTLVYTSPTVNNPSN